MSSNTAVTCKPEIDVLRNGSKAQWRVEVDQANSAEWSRMIDLFDDANIYQTAAYGSVRWGEKNLSRIVLKRDEEVVAIAQLRIVKPTPLNFGIAYVRWGPLWERRDGGLTRAIAKRFVQALEDEYVSKRKLFLRVIPNAFQDSERSLVMQEAFQSFRTERVTSSNTYRTFLLDLLPEVEQIRKNLDKKWRNQLARAEKNNLEVVCGSGQEHFRLFAEIYNDMMRRKAFDTTVDMDEFCRIQESLPEEQKLRVLTCKQGGASVAGLVVSILGNSGIYLLGATSSQGMESKGAYLLQWTMIKEMKSSGIRWYDLGGIDPERNPGVYHFKRGFSGQDICQISPLVRCSSALTNVIVRSALVGQNGVRKLKALSHVKRSRS